MNFWMIFLNVFDGGKRCLKFEEKGKILDLGAVSNRHLGLKKIEI